MEGGIRIQTEQKEDRPTKHITDMWKSEDEGKD